MKRRFWPEDFSAAARKCIEKAKRALNPGARAVLRDRARVLTRSAVLLERSVALRDDDPRMLWSVSTLDDLKRELATLESGQTMRMPTEAFVRLLDAGP